MYKLICKNYNDGDEVFSREYTTKVELERALNKELTEDAASGNTYVYELYELRKIPFTLKVSATID